MKKWLYTILIFCSGFLYAFTVEAQCSVCTKTALQMGEKPAKGLNQGILYLMAAPFAIVGFIGYRWWKNNGKHNDELPQE
jgi:hypothetical protein